MTIPEVHEEVEYAWRNSYSPATSAAALDKIVDAPAPYKIQPSGGAAVFPRHLFPERGKLAG